MTVVVGVSDVKVSRDVGDVLATYALGSCIGVTMYDPVMKVGGMLHFQLPSSTIDPQRANERPLMYADTGMQVLLQRMVAAGAEKRRLKVMLAGAAQMLNDSSMFSIGKRNHAAIRKILWQLGMIVGREEIGGTSPRNMYLAIADGTVTVKTTERGALQETR